MFHASIRLASISATAQASACSRMRWASSVRRSGVNFFESSRPTIRRLGFSTTAPATTGPNKDPRPASSSPAMRIQPRCRASRSYRAEQSRPIGGDFSTGSARSLAAILLPFAGIRSGSLGPCESGTACLPFRQMVVSSVRCSSDNACPDDPWTEPHFEPTILRIRSHSRVSMGSTSRTIIQVACVSGALFGSLVFLASCGSGNNKAIAETAVTKFHSEVDSEQFHAIYTEADDRFRQITTETDFNAFLSAVHRKLGDVKQSDLRNFQVGWHTGEGSVITLSYHTQFVGGDGSEQFV